MRRLALLFVTLCLSFNAYAGTIQRVEPHNWWVGMQHPTVELMLYGDKLAELTPKLDYRGVSISAVHRTDNPNYLFVELTLSADAVAGTLALQLFQGYQLVQQWDYPILSRSAGSAQRQGFAPSDAIYLITPDRFVNGDPSNDNLADMLERANRQDDNGRHGGDLAGMLKALPYLQQLGITAVWPTPLTENNQPAFSYHGYSATDFYRVDPRFGSNAEFRDFVVAANKLGIKVIQDIIVNHIGSNHWWMQDLPAKDWLNFPSGDGKGNFVPTNHNRSTIQDPYAADIDRTVFTDGWFVDTMPDLNQRNPRLATYLIQNSIWWVEYAGLSGIREDTYSYADKAFLSEWGRRIMQEYPNFNIVGEEWSPNPLIVSYWQAGKQNKDGYVSYTPSMLDFPLYDALLKALVEPENWNGGWIRLYEMLSNDHIYANPFNLVIFEGNHDTARLFSVLGEDQDLFRMALSYLFTMRGIPQLFYGTELAMTSPPHRDDGKVRADFPGGWAGDKVNAFTGAGLSDTQRMAQQLVSQLLNWRKTATAIHQGKLLHFAPDRGTYTYFRYNDQQTVMVVMNKQHDAVTLDLSRFRQVLPAGKTALEVLSGEKMQLDTQLSVPARGVLVLDIR
ncbi:glycoside hydrolase family 13 protein [Alishewanella sp. d11]|uniref:glycoside hydrolase family 13 protein n=1 Tax=Alishewanella sp. d11 TaxID=3414030 RepID=UPI003BF7BB0F